MDAAGHDRLGLTVNETKTAVRDARQERFDFLGYSFGPHHYRKDGHWYLGASPSKKSVQRLKTRVGEILVPANIAPWEEVRDRLNNLLRGWASYFGYGTRLMAYRAVDHYVYEARSRLPDAAPQGALARHPAILEPAVFGELGVLRLRRSTLARRRESAR